MKRNWDLHLISWAMKEKHLNNNTFLWAVFVLVGLLNPEIIVKVLLLLSMVSVLQYICCDKVYKIVTLHAAMDTGYQHTKVIQDIVGVDGLHFILDFQ